MPKEEPENSRLELARRLHDGPAQKLVALGYRLDALIGVKNLAPSHRRELREIRLDLMELTEDFRDELYLQSRRDLNSLKSELSILLPGFEIEFGVPESTALLPFEHSLVNLILEIARNSSKYSNGQRFWVNIEIEVDLIRMWIGDNGTKAISVRERSLGLKLINAQVQALNGIVELTCGENGNEYLMEIPRS